MTVYEREIWKNKDLRPMLNCRPNWYYDYPNVLPFICRDEMVKKYSFAILTESMIRKIRHLQPFLEVGCGNGYWAYELRKRQIEIVATDPKIKFKWDHDWIKPDLMRACRALKFYIYKNYTLLICWPTLNDEWAYHALKEFKGKRMVYVGEGESGCCAEEKFFNELEKRWYLEKQITIPQWPGIHDVMWILKRK